MPATNTGVMFSTPNVPAKQPYTPAPLYTPAPPAPYTPAPLYTPAPPAPYTPAPPGTGRASFQSGGVTPTPSASPPVSVARPQPAAPAPPITPPPTTSAPATPTTSTDVTPAYVQYILTGEQGKRANELFGKNVFEEYPARTAEGIGSVMLPKDAPKGLIDYIMTGKSTGLTGGLSTLQGPAQVTYKTTPSTPASVSLASNYANAIKNLTSNGQNQFSQMTEGQYTNLVSGKIPVSRGFNTKSTIDYLGFEPKQNPFVIQAGKEPNQIELFLLNAPSSTGERFPGYPNVLGAGQYLSYELAARGLSLGVGVREGAEQTGEAFAQTLVTNPAAFLDIVGMTTALPGFVKGQANIARYGLFGGVQGYRNIGQAAGTLGATYLLGKGFGEVTEPIQSRVFSSAGIAFRMARNAYVGYAVGDIVQPEVLRPGMPLFADYGKFSGRTIMEAEALRSAYREAATEQKAIETVPKTYKAGDFVRDVVGKRSADFRSPDFVGKNLVSVETRPSTLIRFASVKTPVFETVLTEEGTYTSKLLFREKPVVNVAGRVVDASGKAIQPKTFSIPGNVYLNQFMPLRDYFNGRVTPLSEEAMRVFGSVLTPREPLQSLPPEAFRMFEPRPSKTTIEGLFPPREPRALTIPTEVSFKSLAEVKPKDIFGGELKPGLRLIRSTRERAIEITGTKGVPSTPDLIGDAVKDLKATKTKFKEGGAKYLSNFGLEYAGKIELPKSVKLPISEGKYLFKLTEFKVKQESLTRTLGELERKKWFNIPENPRNYSVSTRGQVRFGPRVILPKAIEDVASPDLGVKLFKGNRLPYATKAFLSELGVSLERKTPELNAINSFELIRRAQVNRALADLEAMSKEVTSWVKAYEQFSGRKLSREVSKRLSMVPPSELPESGAVYYFSRPNEGIRYKFIETGVDLSKLSLPKVSSLELRLPRVSSADLNLPKVTEIESKPIELPKTVVEAKTGPVYKVVMGKQIKIIELIKREPKVLEVRLPPGVRATKDLLPKASISILDKKTAELFKVKPPEEPTSFITKDEFASGKLKKTKPGLTTPSDTSGTSGASVQSVGGGMIQLTREEGKVLPPKRLKMSLSNAPESQPPVSISKGGVRAAPKVSRSLFVPQSESSLTSFLPVVTQKKQDEVSSQRLSVSIQPTATMPKTILKQVQAQVIVQVQPQAQAQPQALLLGQPQAQAQPQALLLGQPQAQAQPQALQTVTLETTAVPVTPILQTPYPTFYSLPSKTASKEQEKRKRVIRGYLVLGKLKGPKIAFKQVFPKPLPLGEAVTVGAKYALGSLRATFRLVPAQEEAKGGFFKSTPLSALGEYFRKPLPGSKLNAAPLTFIQKQTKRLVTPEERREIQQARATAKGKIKSFSDLFGR